MKIKLKILKISITMIFIGYLTWACVGHEWYDRTTYSRKICNNLQQAGLIVRDGCVKSKRVPEVMEFFFPTGANMSYIQQGMEGFAVNLRSSGRSDDCRQWSRVDYKIIYNIFSWETYEFIFCDGTLIGKVWHN